MTVEAWDPLKTLRTLDRHRVRFVVIGGLAARLQGSPSVTNDTDICYERSPENAERLTNALRSLRATLRGVADDVPFRLDAATVLAGDHFTFATSAGNLDCLGTPAGADFEALWASSSVVDLDGLTAHVAAIDDLIAMKRAAGRRKDAIEVEVLLALKEEVERTSRADRP
jgi:predicted nucleotidyltransferase